MGSWNTRYVSSRNSCLLTGWQMPPKTGALCMAWLIWSVSLKSVLAESIQLNSEASYLMTLVFLSPPGRWSMEKCIRRRWRTRRQRWSTRLTSPNTCSFPSGRRCSVWSQAWWCMRQYGWGNTTGSAMSWNGSIRSGMMSSCSKLPDSYW